MQKVYQNYEADTTFEKMCPHCKEEEDSTEHLVTCKAIGNTTLTNTDLMNTDNKQMWRQIIERVSFNLENRKRRTDQGSHKV